MSFGVYGIFFPGDYVYVGSTVSSLQTRHRVHLHALKQGVHDNDKMQELFNKYQTCEFRHLQEFDVRDEELIRGAEQYYIEELGKTYHLCNELQAEQEGGKLPDNVKKKISDGVKRAQTIKKPPSILRKYADNIQDSGTGVTVNEAHMKNLQLRKTQGW